MAKVLVVDDIEDNIKLLQYDLEDDGYEVCTASNGREALVVARLEHPDIVLLDVMMPEMDGIETCRHFKADTQLARIPIIVVSARDQEQDIIRGLDVGAHDYVSKPIVYSVVAARIRSALRVKQYEDSILDLNEALYREKERAEKSLRARSSFLATVSHEIRTPITAIMGLSEMLSLEHVECPFDSKQVARSILTNSRYLLEVINNILDISKAESGELQIEMVRCSLLNIIEDVRGIVDLKALEKGLIFVIDIHYPIPEMVISDPTRLKQLLVNFATNAIKFTAKGSVRIGLDYDVSKKLVAFSIQDTGIGMSEKEQKKLFVPFQQANQSIHRRYGGTGLGMSISKQIVDHMQGSIEVESERGKGSTFTIRIPIKEVEGAVLLKDAPLTRDSRFERKKIQFQGCALLVEDDVLNQRLVRHVLEQFGMTVKVAGNGRDAVTLAQQESIDVIFMDIHLPDISGIEATRSIKAAGVSVPIVGLTASQFKEDLEAFMQVGCEEFLQKPLDRNQLRVCLQRVLHTPSSESSARPSNVSQDFISIIEPGLHEQVQQYVQRLIQQTVLVREALKMGNVEEARNETRSMTGAGLFGFPRIALAAKLLEDQLECNDSHVLESLLGRLQREIDEAVQDLEMVSDSK